MTVTNPQKIAIIGGGPAGLMAAQELICAGYSVALFERKASVGRKFLVAGKGGLNLSHSESMATFATRFGQKSVWVNTWLQQFDNQAIRQWALALGVPTIVGSSGRIFPNDLKAAPLLRSWVKFLRERGVVFHTNHYWQGWNDRRELLFRNPLGESSEAFSATILALGGASWPQLGSDGAWVKTLSDADITVAPLKPSNCGFVCRWSQHFIDHFRGQPLKPVILKLRTMDNQELAQQGELMISETGIEGGLLYAHSAQLREQIGRDGVAMIELDLAPTRTLAELTNLLSRDRGSRSWSEHIRRQAKISALQAALVYEVLPKPSWQNPLEFADALKALPLRLTATSPIAEAISTAGGVCESSLDEHLMLTKMPGAFCAGEMLDWEAPTGGYLLNASMASGVNAARGVMEYLGRSES
jgi:uncharacterized flavoprotein (TIGR03862 family)